MVGISAACTRPRAPVVTVDDRAVVLCLAARLDLAWAAHHCHDLRVALLVQRGTVDLRQQPELALNAAHLAGASPVNAQAGDGHELTARLKYRQGARVKGAAVWMRRTTWLTRAVCAWRDEFMRTRTHRRPRLTIVANRALHTIQSRCTGCARHMRLQISRVRLAWARTKSDGEWHTARGTGRTVNSTISVRFSYNTREARKTWHPDFCVAMAAIRTALTRVAAGRLRYSATSERLWVTAHGVACARAPASIARVTASPDLAWRACATASRSVHTACVAPRAGVDGSITDIPPRDSSFSVVSGDDMAAFRSMLGAGAAGRVVTDPDQLSAFNIDWMQKWGGNAPAALRPKTTGNVMPLAHALCAARALVLGADTNGVRR